MRNRVLLLWIAIACCVLSGYAQSYYFKHLGIADGLSQVRITAICQDKTGAIWLGSSEGLNRYNGNDVRLFHPSQNSEGLTNNEIEELCADNVGNIYINAGFDLVRLNVETETFTSLRNNDVRGVFCASDSIVWVGVQDGICTCSANADSLQMFAPIDTRSYGRVKALSVDGDTLWVVTRDNFLAISRKDPSKIKRLFKLKMGECVLKAKSGDIWVGGWDGVYRITSATHQVIHYPAKFDGDGPSDNQVRSIIEDDFGQIWIGTYRGIDCCIINSEGEVEWKHYTSYGNTSNALSHHSVISLYKDNTGNIWVGTYYGGVNIFNPNRASSHFYEAELNTPGRLSFPIAGRMSKDKSGDLWVCTEGGGLNRLHDGEFTTYKHQNGNSTTLGANTLKSIYYHPGNNHLYIGTHLGGMYVFDCGTGKGHSLHHVEGDATSLPHEIVNDIQPYKDGLAVLTQGGPAFFNLQTEKFSPIVDDVKLQLNWEYSFETFFIDNKQRAWLAYSAGGLLCVDFVNKTAKRYSSSSSNPSAIGKFKIVKIFQSSRGEVYFCTIGSGLFKYIEADNSFKVYNSSNGSLPSDYCYYVCDASDDNHLYVLHREGVSLFDVKNEKTDITYHLFDQTFAQGSSLLLDDKNVLYVSGTNGLASYSLSENGVSRKSNLKFDRLFVLNKEVVPGDDTGILKRILSMTSSIRLNYKENNLSVEFATFNYGNGQHGTFEYKLDGFDKMWTRTSGNMVTYTSLSPGDYVLKVHSLPYNSESDDEISLAIHISSPFYLTVWAYMLYALIAVALLAVWLRSRTRQAILRSSLAYERKEKERIEELNKLKLRFFTNISHEFRTPLSLIVGQIEMILNDSGLSDRLRGRVQSVYRNAWHMRNLISELLDFRKQEQGYLKLKVEEHDFVAFTRRIYLCFSEYAAHKNVKYNMYSAEETLNVWFDPVQIQKVVFNLLSNAFKYTPAGGSVTVEIHKDESNVTLSVSDTGIGIPEADLDRIFNRFYRVSENSSQAEGSGIGLALAQGIMNLHHGRIEAKSRVGEGTTFVLTLQLGCSQFKKEEIAGMHDEKDYQILPETLPFTPYEDDVDVSDEQSNAAESDETVSENDNRPIVLLVEDNAELLSMLKDIFSSYYTVYTAPDGEAGWDIARKVQPDLVVSDVMMPKKSGIELCKEIKDSVELSHVSVVLLTARVSEEYMVDGLMYGADGYIPKPFSIKVLLAKCESILANKKRLLSHYDTSAGSVSLSDTSSGSVDAVAVPDDKDKKFIDDCVAFIHANISDSELKADALASHFNISKSSLYKRFNKVVGVAPNEFILKVKFDEAMRLLKTRPDMNVTDIALSLGFSSQRYFSRSFKVFFGVAPQTVRSGEKETSQSGI